MSQIRTDKTNPVIFIAERRRVGGKSAGLNETILKNVKIDTPNKTMATISFVHEKCFDLFCFPAIFVAIFTDYCV